MEDRSLPIKDENQPVKQQTTGTENIVQQHLKDPNHVITDEDIKNVEVGKTDRITTTGAEAQTLFEKDIQEDKEGETSINREIPPPNPWDVLK